VSLLAVIGFTFAPKSVHAETLSEALAATYNNNPQLASQRALVRQTDEAASQAFSGWLPRAGGSYSKGREERETAGFLGRRNTTKADTETWQVYVEQPIFSGGSTYYGMKQADNKIEAARAELYRVEQNVLLSTVQSFAGIAREQEVLYLSQNNEAVLRKHLEVTEERFRLGEVTRTDVAQAKARLALAESERLQAEGNLTTAQASFRKITGLEPNVPAMPEMPEGIPGSLADARAQALRDNPSLISAIYTEMAAENTVDVTRANLLPNVSLRGNMLEEDGTLSSQNGPYNAQSVTLNVNIPIFQSGIEYSRIRAAKEDVARLRSTREDSYNSVKEYVTRVWRDYEVAQSTIGSTQTAVEAAQVALDGVIQEAQVGSRTTLDVLDAEQELFSAKVDHVRAQYNAVTAAYSVKLAIGQLTAQALGLSVELFDPQEHYDDVKYQFIGY
jgi:outer membrane protein